MECLGSVLAPKIEGKIFEIHNILNGIIIISLPPEYEQTCRRANENK